MPLSEEQRKKIEENRQRALAKRKNVSCVPISEKLCAVDTINKNTLSVPGPGVSWALAKQNQQPSTIPLRATPNCATFSSKYKNSQPIGNKSVVNGTSTNQFYGNVKTIKAKFILIDNKTFKIEMGYHPGAISLFKSIESGKYNATERTWSFEIKDHNELVRKLRPLNAEVQLDVLPRWILETFNYKRDNRKEKINLNASVNSDPYSPQVEPCLWDNLMPFQREGVRYALERGGRILLADDMGLGKTIQSLGIASAYKSKWPLLIVCPSSMRFAWRSAVVRWLPSVPEEDVSVITAGNDEINPSDQVLIISYNLLSRKERELIDWNFHVAIMDESHFIKDSKSARYKASVAILNDKVDHLIMLSGTPALSRPIELYTQISLLDPKLFKYVTDFGMRYCDGRKLNFGAGKSAHDFSGHSNMVELKILMEERFMIRRIKSDVLSQLPSKSREMIILDPALVKSKSKVMQEKAQCMTQLRDKSKEHAMLLEWFHLTSDAKVNAVIEYIKDLLEGERKFLIFAHHQTMMKRLSELLEKQKVKYIMIDGRTSSLARKTYCDDFQTNDQIRVALLSITAANTGLTLTAAQLVVFAELFWNPGELTQAEDRAHRIGQTDSVTIQYLVALNTADDKLWPMIQKKLDVLNEAGLSKDNFSKSDSRNVQQNVIKSASKSPKAVNCNDKELLDDIDWDLNDNLENDMLEDVNWDETFEL